MSFKADVKSSGGLDIIRSVSSTYICYTNFSDSTSAWNISITDGFTVWSITLLEKDIKKFKTSLTNINEGLREGNVKVSSNNDQLSVTITCPQQDKVELDLVKLSDEEIKVELKTLIFRQMSLVNSLQDDLKSTVKKLDDIKKASSQNTSLYTDLSGVTSNSKATSKPVKPVGHSILNPSAKRRKAAGGVVFGEGKDDDDD